MDIASQSANLVQCVSQPKFTFSEADGAFFGAFFAFLFGVATFFMQKKFERYHKHKNAVVELEHLLQEHLDTIYANEYLVEGAVDTIDKRKLSFTLFSQLRVINDISIRLGELGLMNRYFGYQSSLLRMNHSMETWQKMNEKLHEAVIAGIITPEAIEANQNHLKDQVIVVGKFLKGLYEDASFLVSYVRVFMRKDKHIWSVILTKKITKNSEEIVTDKEAKKELAAMKEEIKEIGNKSKARITEILSKDINDI